MKFVSFKNQKTSKISWGVLNQEKQSIADLSHLGADLLSFLRGPWKQQWRQVEEALLQASLPTAEVEFLACLPNPQSVRDGYAFRQHVEAARRNRGLPMAPEFDAFPIFYYTNHTAIVGPGPVYVQEKALQKLDFELEAAVVIGKKGMNIPAEKADEFIFGYTIMNDFSARQEQMEEMKLSLGPAKGKDFATALGSWLVTPEELKAFKIPSQKGDRYDLEMLAFHNGKEVSQGNLKDMTWTFAQIIERVSYGTWIYPGDVIGSGTVGTGCYLELNGTFQTSTWLKPGDKITLKISGLGELENTVVYQEAQFRES